MTLSNANSVDKKSAVPTAGMSWQKRSTTLDVWQHPIFQGAAKYRHLTKYYLTLRPDPCHRPLLISLS